jgi:hypothetical protein
MAGLLKKPRQQAPQQQAAPAEQMPAEQSMPQQGAPVQPGMEDQAGEADENNPAFLAAVNQVKTALYKEGAADSVNEALKTSEDPINTISTLAYELTAVADEKASETVGEVPDELLVLLASTVLSEVVDIATASGIQLSAADIGEALKKMILRFMGEQGVDTRGLEEAMNQVSPEQMNQIAAEVQ